ncbi:DUF4350 domain-containing protein [Muriicola sp. Z0-33]|uniref:DUF4350 domain-containing protein n=1 Tax=Muriicola sp. Z0-33 TaxID=2816957 RepID=UPI00223904E5|nr:DUF4350 domain-containing protein [Muriicola sp. Z0-33]MCW5517520.1 DUF4350 domain-containing protein [Muriicola sp. Z0-33]
MDRRTKIIIGLFIAVLLGIIVTEVVKPKPLNWRPSYTANDKIPFGCYVLFQELPNLFPQAEIKRAEETPFNVLFERDTIVNASYIFINSALNFDEQETNSLLEFVDSGNDVFMAASFFGNPLSDTLNLEVYSEYAVQQDTISLNFTNAAFANEIYYMDRGHYKTHFTRIDTLNTTILGGLQFNGNDFINGGNTTRKEVNFIKVKFGEGHFYLNTLPQAYTNYYLLNNNQQYAANSLSYLKRQNVIWDAYEKAGRIIITSPMRFVLNQQALKWAYYLTIIGLLIFVIFKAKREQRIIPIIDPLPNTSVDFAKTVGGLYYQHRNYTNLITKKLNYFLEFVRSHYYLNTSTITEKTAADLAAKSGKSLIETKALLEHIVYLKNKSSHTEKDLIALNKKIASFKQ